MSTSVKSVSLSDIHSNHRRTPYYHTVESISKWIIANNKTIIKSDIFFIPGDLFDSLMSLADGSLNRILMCLVDIMAICEKHNIVFRVLEGTHSHDWGQSSILNVIALSFPKLNYKYIPSVTVEHIDHLNVDILYVPDEVSHDPKDTEIIISDALAEHGVSKVDIAVMHGSFPHQFPDIKGMIHHDPIFFRKIVRGYVIIGHIHKFSIYDGFIITPGSFERLSHGEEEDKGGVFIDWTDGKVTVRQLVNQHSMMYRDIKVIDDGSSLKDDLEALLMDYEGLGNIRLVGTKDKLYRVSVEEAMSRYPGIRFTRKIIKTVASETTHAKIRVMETQKVTKHNLIKIVGRHLDEEGMHSDKDALLGILKEVITDE